MQSRTARLPLKGKIIALEREDKKLCLVFHNKTWHLADDCCPHQGASMSLGYVDDDLLFCPWHKIGFVLGDGRSPLCSHYLKFYKIWQEDAMLYWQPE